MRRAEDCAEEPRRRGLTRTQRRQPARATRRPCVVHGDLAVKCRLAAAEVHCGALTTGRLVSEGDMEACETMQARTVVCDRCRVHAPLEMASTRTLVAEIAEGADAVRSLSAKGGSHAGYLDVCWLAPVPFACGQQVTVRVRLPHSDTEEEGALIVALSATEGSASVEVGPGARELALTVKRRRAESTRVCWIGARLLEEHGGGGRER